MKPQAVRRAIAAILVAALAWLGLSWGLEAVARSCRVSLLPNGSRYNCGNCHTSSGGGGARNAFGNEVGRRIAGGSCNSFWGPELAALDSDGDGRSNGEELGDPAGAWRPGQAQPGDRSSVLNPGVREVSYLRGDANGDGSINVGDAIFLLQVLFARHPHSSCRAAEDADGNGRIDITDAIHQLQFLFQNGPAPAAPFPGCGVRAGTQTCVSYGRCRAG